MIYDVIILGAGPAGLTAALYASRSGLKTLVLDKTPVVGGQIALTSLVENWPGVQSTDGPALSNNFADHAKKFGAEIKNMVSVSEVELEGKVKKLKTSAGDFEGKSLIIATGAKERTLGVPGEEEYKGKGVSYCATCDAPFFKDKNVVVIGGGSAAFDEGLYITKFAKQVTFVHRREEFRAEQILIDRAKNNDKVKFQLNKIVVSIIGNEQGVEKIKLKDTKDDSESEFQVDGVFIYIGMLPNTELFKGKLNMNDNNYLITNDNMETNIKGVFAAGDVRFSPVKQITTATSDGTIAATMALKYLEG